MPSEFLISLTLVVRGLRCSEQPAGHRRRPATASPGIHGGFILGPGGRRYPRQPRRWPDSVPVPLTWGVGVVVFRPDWCGFINMGSAFAIIKARNQSARVCGGRSLRDRAAVPGCLPYVSPEVLWRLRLTPPPQVTLQGYTQTDASPFRHMLGCCCHSDNVHTIRRRREFMRLLANTLVRIRPLTCHAQPPRGAASIFAVTQAVADDRGVCSGGRRQYTTKHGTVRDIQRRTAGSNKGKVPKLKGKGRAY